MATAPTPKTKTASSPPDFGFGGTFKKAVSVSALELKPKWLRVICFETVEALVLFTVMIEIL